MPPHESMGIAGRIVLAVLWTVREAVLLLYFMECMSTSGQPVFCSAILHGHGG